MCNTCGGTGYIEADTIVPYGDTWVRRPGREACPDCLERDLCPRCGEALRTAKRQVFGRFVTDAAWCPACGWCDD